MISICIKLCQLYLTVWKSISYHVKSSISFCSDLYQLNSCKNFTDSFCASLFMSVTLNQTTEIQRELNYRMQTFAQRAQNFTSHYLMNDLFITLKEYCVLSKTVITNSICDSLPGFTFQKVYILISLRTTERQFYTTFKKFMILVITWMHNIKFYNYYISFFVFNLHI